MHSISQGAAQNLHLLMAHLLSLVPMTTMKAVRMMIKVLATRMWRNVDGGGHGDSKME